MKLTHFAIATVVGSLGFFAQANAALVPVNVSGYNAAIVVPASATVSGGSVAGSISATMDGGTNKSGSTYYEAGAPGAPAGTGLPAAGAFTLTNGDTYTLQPYTSNNVLFFGRNYAPQNNAAPNATSTTGTFTFPSNIATTTLGFATAAAVGDFTVDLTIHFADGSTDSSLSYGDPDWVGGSGTVITSTNGHRIIPTSDSFDGNNGKIYEETVTLPLAEQSLAISSIDFTIASGTPANNAQFSDAVIFGVSADVPEPASLGLITVGALGLLARRRRAV